MENWITEIMLETGMTREEALKSWAYTHEKEAREIMKFFSRFIGAVRSISTPSLIK